MSDASIELILCDVGGVLGTNGWDHDERRLATAHFGLDFDAFELRHEEAAETWETGQMTIGEYLDFTIFNVERSFTRDEFIAFMQQQSVPNQPAIDLMRDLSRQQRWRMLTMNNESAELHEYRAGRFGLGDIFSAFLTSAYIVAQKPRGLFYDRALAIAHAIPERTVFIDDRMQNLEPAKDRGVHVVHATDTNAVRQGLAALGVTAGSS